MTETTRVLVVEDSAGDALLIRELLDDPAHGLAFEIEHVTRHGDALRRLAAVGPGFEVVLHDLGLPDAEGLEPIERLSAGFPDLAIVVLTGRSDSQSGIDALKRGAQDYLVKGRVDAAGLARTLRYAIERRRVERALRGSEAEHRLLFDLNPMPVFAYDTETLRFLLVNDAATVLYGWDRDAFLGLSLDEVFRVEDRAALDELLAGPLPPAYSAGVWRQRTAVGHELMVDITCSAFEFRGRSARLVIARDITEQERTRNALAISEKRHRDLFAMSKGLICVHDMAGVLVTVNPAAAELLGYLPEEMTGTTLASYVPPEHAAKFQLYLDGFATSDEHEGLLILRAKSGELRLLQFSNSVYVEDGRRYVIGHAQDVTERRRYEQRLRELSFSDPLTGLFNRRYLSQRESDAAPGARFGVIAVDLDHFKQINDTLGHQRGDEVLIAVGRFLKRHARSQDVVVRMGGDEFLVLLPDADAAATEALAERMKSDGANAPCGLSIGHAVRVGDEALEKTINRADLTLYRIRIELRGYGRRKYSSDEDASGGSPP